jgi:hypothetical protein
MYKELIFSLDMPYREKMKIYGYRFGHGEPSACIVGPTRGNEIQQLYICSQLIRILSSLERNGDLHANKEILVIPSVNHFSANIERRFWELDNTDINRMFPGDPNGETTQRIAAGIFERVRGYNYGIQFASFHTPGDFIPHVRMMATGHQSESLANLFGLPYVLTRKPDPFETVTLNYNWQLSGTNAFSVYAGMTEQISETAAMQAVSSVLRFLTRMGILKYNCHSGYISTVIEENALFSIRSNCSGIYRRLKNPGDEVHFGDVLAQVADPFEGEILSEIISPSDGILFFAHAKSLVQENGVIYQMIRRLHE